MEEVVYLIITRFALKNNIWRKSLYDSFSKEDWQRLLEERLLIFKELNLPSIKAQTNQNFDYLIYVDKSFPEYSHIQKELEEVCNENDVKLQYVTIPWGDGGPTCPFFEPLKVQVQEYVQKNYPRCNWLISTRLDSDDLIAKDFIEESYNNFEKKERWLSFEKGYCLLILKNRYICYSDWASSHIIYCERFHQNGEFCKTAFHRTHSRLGFKRDNEEKIKTISSGRGWWLDLVGLDSNMARNNRYLKDKKSQRIWDCPDADPEEIKKYIETGNLL